MGVRGPAPKRSDKRLGHQPTAAKDAVEKVAGADEVKVPAADKKWHPIARRWYESLSQSGQHVFYEASDWATAFLLAEAMSRELRPQGIVWQGKVVSYELMTVKAGTISALLKGMSDLMVTEGSRRRVALELQRPPSGPAGDGPPAPVSDIRAWRERLSS